MIVRYILEYSEAQETIQAIYILMPTSLSRANQNVEYIFIYFGFGGKYPACPVALFCIKPNVKDGHFRQSFNR